MVVRSGFFDAPYSTIRCKGDSIIPLPGGHNGPYFDTETSVRNTAHWLCIISKLLSDGFDEELARVGHSAVNFLLSQKCRPMGATFHCRSNPEKDFCNGVMGQAWAIEGLVAAAKILDRPDALKEARDVFLLHPFVEEFGVWRRVNVDGSYLTIDPTFNHQLWFAAIATTLEDDIASSRALRFLDNVLRKIKLYSNGVLLHNSPVDGGVRLNAANAPRLLRYMYKATVREWTKKKLYSKSVGYHAFNLYAFAILNKSFPEHPFWSSQVFRKMLEVTTTKSFCDDLDNSAYGWPYNPPGIELAYVGEVFGLGKSYIASWLDKQYSRTFNHETKEWLTLNVPDPNTASARIYEATRIEGNYCD